MEKKLTPYEEWQQTVYGNILQPAGNTKDEDLEQSGIDELERFAEWMEAMAQIEELDK
jgi:hypothetical protein